MLSVIVPRYANNQRVADETDANLRVLRLPPQREVLEIIVVDNGSSVTAAHVPCDVLVAFPTNKGVAPAWNEGRRQAHGDVLCFVTSSTLVNPASLYELASVARRDRVIAMPFDAARRTAGHPGVTGWCWAITTALFDEIGGLDETFVPAQYEDTDFFHRAIDLGVELVNVAEASCVHESRAHTNNDERFQWLHMANRFRYGWKHGVDPRDMPPFWKQPLRVVNAAPPGVPTWAEQQAMRA